MGFLPFIYFDAVWCNRLCGVFVLDDFCIIYFRHSLPLSEALSPMKLLRLIHFGFGVLAASILLSIPWMLISAHFRSVEMAREDAMENRLVTQLETYQQAHGRYPDSLSALTITDSPQDMRIMQKMSYHPAPTGFTLSYSGSFHSSATVSHETK